MNKLRSFFTALTIALGLAFLGTAVPARADLLNLTLGFPLVLSDAGSACSYNAGTGTLTLQSLPTLVVFESTESNVGFVADGSMDISASLDSSGGLISGTFTLTGSVTDDLASETFASPLLTGTIVAYGIAPPGTTDNADFRIQPTGGTLLSRYGATDQIGVNVTLETSSFNGSFTTNWGCVAAKMSAGPIPPLVQETCALSLTKTANPTTIGPIVTPSGHDKPDDSDVDSHHDRNNDGDSDSEDDSGGGPVTCGCKGKVSELTLRYNGSVAANVIVSRKPPFSTVLFSGTVQPGTEFTVMGSDVGPNGFKGTLGTAIEIAVDGGATVDMHTSCSQPIGPGLVAGDFEVVSGESKKLNVPLCPIPGTGCPANQQVTYTYTLTNNGSPLTNVMVNDDKLGSISAGTTLNGGQTVTFTKTACLFQTTTNMATASGSLPSGSLCAATPASATVTLVLPPPPDEPPPPPPSTGEGCSHGYWKNHMKTWVSFKPGDKFGAVFQVDSAGNRSLLDTLKMGGGDAKALGREAVAALLNATHPDVSYFYEAAEIKSIVQNAFTTKDFETAKNLLELRNTADCPLN